MPACSQNVVFMIRNKLTIFVIETSKFKSNSIWLNKYLSHVLIIFNLVIFFFLLSISCKIQSKFRKVLRRNWWCYIFKIFAQWLKIEPLFSIRQFIFFFFQFILIFIFEMDTHCRLHWFINQFSLIIQSFNSYNFFVLLVSWVCFLILVENWHCELFCCNSSLQLFT